MTGFTYRGQNVTIPFTAEIPADFRPGRRRAHLVQGVINSTKPWKEGDDPIETDRVSEMMPVMIVENRNRSPFWAVHVGHKARNPQVSPFLNVRTRYFTDKLTLELVGTPERPRLVRAYQGGYIPPLPWQGSAKDAEGGVAFCQEFWRTHSYVCKPQLIHRNTRTQTPPSWFSAGRHLSVAR